MNWIRQRGRRRDTWDNRRSWLVQKLRPLPRPLGVLAYNDGVAANVIDACGSAGIRVPEEVAVLGVDNDEILRVRLERSRQLLTQTDLPVTEICERVGFASLQHLYQVFSKAEGMPPRKYRLRHRSVPEPRPSRPH